MPVVLCILNVFWNIACIVLFYTKGLLLPDDDYVLMFAFQILG